MSNKKRPFWCGWEVPNGIPFDDMLAKWPDDMRGWCSGEGDDYVTYVGVVFAESEDAARELVLSCYGEHADEIAVRWEPKSYDVGTPPSEGGRWLGEDRWFTAKLVEYES